MTTLHSQHKCFAVCSSSPQRGHIGLSRSEVRELLALNVDSENYDTRSGLAVLLRFHIQAPWNWTEYAVDRQAFALPSTTVLMDDSGLNNHGIMVGSGWRLQVPC